MLPELNLHQNYKYHVYVKCDSTDMDNIKTKIKKIHTNTYSVLRDRLLFWYDIMNWCKCQSLSLHDYDANSVPGASFDKKGHVKLVQLCVDINSIPCHNLNAGIVFLSPGTRNLIPSGKIETVCGVMYQFPATTNIILYNLSSKWNRLIHIFLPCWSTIQSTAWQQCVCKDS